jgi:hypothetical protein
VRDAVAARKWLVEPESPGRTKLLQACDYFGFAAMHGDEVQHFPVERAQGRFIGLAKARGPFHHRVEYGGQVTGRGIDDLQNLCGCCLLGQCLVPLSKRLVALSIARGKLPLQIGY